MTTYFCSQILYDEKYEICTKKVSSCMILFSSRIIFSHIINSKHTLNKRIHT